MNMILPNDVENIIKVLEAKGYEAYAVGGCVRDTLLGRNPKDWDITTSARPEQVKELFDHTIDTGIEHGTVTVMQNHIGYEVTTYRIDGEYEDARHPKEVIFTPNLREDLKRRDFTINAMAYNPTDGLVDLFDGAGDLERGVIRCVGDARERFSEDALRMLRAIRFSAQLGFKIDQQTCDAIRELAPTIAKISVERIATELIKTITSGHPDYLEKAYELGLTAVFLPEFDRMMETPQKNKHHMYTVGKHSLVAMEQIEPDRILRLTMLLHDVAKPLCITVDERGQEHYFGHPEKGADLSRQILRRLKLDNDTISQVCHLIRYHDERPAITPKTIRYMMNEIGVEVFPNLFAVKYADVLAQSRYAREAKMAYVDECRRAYESSVANGECVTIKQLSVDGRDLLATGISQGREIGECLNYLLHKVLDDPKKNQKDILLGFAKQWMSGENNA